MQQVSAAVVNFDFLSACRDHFNAAHVVGKKTEVKLIVNDLLSGILHRAAHGGRRPTDGDPPRFCGDAHEGDDDSRLSPDHDLCLRLRLCPCPSDGDQPSLRGGGAPRKRDQHSRVVSC